MHRIFRFVRPALVALSAVCGLGSAAAERLNFSVEVQDRTTDLAVFFAPVMPGEILEIEVPGRPDELNVQFEAPEAGEALLGPTTMTWKAPDEHGVYPVRVSNRATGETMLINVFVLVPATEIEDGRLNGYRIGQYPEEPMRGLDAYRAPLGFIEVTDENAGTQISPRFTIGQFLCKQATDADQKYVVLRPPLIQKLERAIDALNEEGLPTSALFVMSGYRTPFYNKAIGNVPNSRHVYGDAADVYVDLRPRDGDMDDLNRDGVVNKEDANYFYDLVSRIDGGQAFVMPRGGLGSYDRNSAHGPFLHIDTRGYPARWGR